MLRPHELTANLPMVITDGAISTTGKVWDILVASKNGDLDTVKKLAGECSALIYAQYNYTPPIHFAVREGHVDLVKYLLNNGAHDPAYKIYPFLDTLQVIAGDRGYVQMVDLLDEYAANHSLHKHKGDNGEIHYNRTELQEQFQKAVYKEEIRKVKQILTDHPAFAKDETYFWGEGIMTFAAKVNNRDMIDLLISYGAKVPDVIKWAPAYYFERYDGASYMMEKGMNPDTMSWHHVTILHNMAQKGDIHKAELLLKYGAGIDPVEEEYQSTPLGMASRWGHADMVSYLIKQGADINKAGAAWAKPLAWAQKKKHAEIEKMLLSAGAKK